ncbi:MAG: hypothetical protein GX811_04470 [Lentisphaerae bacterium]|nr:hypothetical protein [Lentisphaerota bacterium]
MSADEKKRLNNESELWNAITAFEKILEALPNDRVSLETLIEAYEKVGDYTRAKEYLVRLANLLVNESDEDATRDLLRKISQYDESDPQIAAAIATLKDYKPEKVMATVFDEVESVEKKTVSIADEISFAWNLLQAKKIQQDAYSTIVQDLSENSTKNLSVPVSTLHVINDRKMPELNEVAAYASKDSKTPLIALSGFDLNYAAVSLIPLEFIIRRGAIVFNLMGSDALVAILNPYDLKLREDVEDLLGRICHFYLAMPEEFDAAIDNIKQHQAES